MPFILLNEFVMRLLKSGRGEMLSSLPIEKLLSKLEDDWDEWFVLDNRTASRKTSLLVGFELMPFPLAPLLPLPLLLERMNEWNWSSLNR